MIASAANATPWLDIVIPTRNRAHALRKTLPDTIRQAEKFGAVVSLYDNASTDDTKAYLTALADNHPIIQYRRHTENIGLDRNMLAGIQHTRAPYVLWLGDDDMLCPDALDTLRRIIENTQADLILLNMACDPTGSLRETVEDLAYDDPPAFFSRHVFHMPFGTTLFKSSFVDALESSQRFVGTYHAYTGLLTDALAERSLRGDSCRIFVSKDLLVTPLTIEKSWISDKSDVILNGIPAWFDMLHPLYNSARVDPYLEFLASSEFSQAACSANASPTAPSPNASVFRLWASLAASNARATMLDSQLSDATAYASILKSRICTLVDGWTWTKWRLMPWTKPKWRNHPLDVS